MNNECENYCEEMQFPNTFEEFLNEYSFKDSDEIYTNGSELIQTFRVMQGYEHFVKQIRADAIDEFKTDIINKIDFEEKWLMNCKSNNADTNIAFGALKTFANNRAEQLKEQKNDNTDKDYDNKPNN